MGATYAHGRQSTRARPSRLTRHAPCEHWRYEPDIWNPLPSFTDVQQDGQVGNIQNTSRFLADAQAGILPAVSWMVRVRQSDNPPQHRYGPGVRHQPDQYRDARPGLGIDRHLPGLG